MKNIYNDKAGLAYAAPLWVSGLMGLNFLITGLFVFNFELILFGICMTFFVLRKDILYFAKSDRFFLVTLVIQVAISSFLMVIGVNQQAIELALISGAISLIWTLFFYVYLLKKLDWND